MITERIPTREEIIARKARLGMPIAARPVVARRTPARDIMAVATPGAYRTVIVEVDYKPLIRRVERAPRSPINRIIIEVAKKYGLTVIDLKSSRRARALVIARQEAMWRARHETLNSYPMIGMHLGGRDHTTIIHGVRAYQARIDRGEIEPPQISGDEQTEVGQ